MSLNQVQNAFDLLGQGPSALRAQARRGHLPGQIEPQLKVGWGEFRQSFGSSLRALVTGPRAGKTFPIAELFRDCRIERRIPRRALLAAALWHAVFVVMPFPQLRAVRKNPAFENFELSWSGRVNDLPLLEIPAEKAKASPHAEGHKPPPLPVEAFHPRQRIFTDSAHPTHPRQTLINPAAPFVPPKILPNLPNMVQFQRSPDPARPRVQISDETLKKLRPRERRAVATAVDAPLPDAPNMEQRPANISIAVSTSVPARPKLELNTGAAPRLTSKRKAGDVLAAPEVRGTQMSAVNGRANALIALSATPAPPAPAVQPPAGNLAARIAISPEGARRSASGEAPKRAAGKTDGPAAKNSVGVSISGGNPPAASANSGLGGAGPKISMPSAHRLITRPDDRGSTDDAPERMGPPDFAALPAGAKPEQIFASKRVYTMNVNMPNLNSATGSWILNFSELRTNPDGPRMVAVDLSGPVPLKKVDPKYPPSLVSDRVEGEVVLYAVIRRDGSVDSIQLVRGIDEQLDENAMNALAQWKFRPGAKSGVPVELEAIVHIPFRIPTFR